ncbi:L-fucose:H+ symporter permease [Terriglobus tenax]|uniref:L-fucose:H+ symporter permease n=1 Tax=Terriglobus tenax TaxID=1111115 RepID=UPI0021DF4EF5|nr:L-fucose:H+ symporter permease [Terriglobus tenax]
MQITPPAANGGQGKGSIFPPGPKRAFLLVTVLFFLWGMSNNLTDILVQQFRKSFELTPTQAQLVQTSVFMGYFCMAIPAALLMERKGYKGGMLAGLILFGVGTISFWPAALAGRYSLFLCALFFVGCGSAILETASNPYIAQAGTPETAERRLNFSQAFNPLGTITGVLMGTYFIFSGVEPAAQQVAAMKAANTYALYLHTEIMRVVPVYVGLGCLVFLWAYLIWRTPFESDASRSEATEAVRFRDVLSAKYLWFAVIAQFFTVGGQVTTWSALIPYLKQYTILPERTAAHFLTACLVAFAIGRVVSTALMKWVRPLTLVACYAVLSGCAIGLAILHPGRIGAVGLVLSSFCIAPMFPTIFASGVEGLGRATKLGGSMLVMSVVGGAVLPPVLGLVARARGSYAEAYSITAFCYVVVAIYAVVALRRPKTLLTNPE